MSDTKPPRYTMIRVHYSTWEKLHQLSLRGEKLVALLERLAQAELTPPPVDIPSDHRILLAVQRQVRGLTAERDAMREQIRALAEERDALAVQLAADKSHLPSTTFSTLSVADERLLADVLQRMEPPYVTYAAWRTASDALDRAPLVAENKEHQQ